MTQNDGKNILKSQIIFYNSRGIVNNFVTLRDFMRY